jgi:1-acyl-sn-glycerol-3-phosphate acyltransferase
MTTVPTDVTNYQVLLDRCKEPPSVRTEVAVIARDQELARTISVILTQDEGFAPTKITTPTALSSTTFSTTARVVYLPHVRESGMAPELSEADIVFAKCASAGVRCFVLVSSALVYDASFRNPGLMVESYPLPKDRNGAAIASRWRRLEIAAKRHFNSEQLTILRCVTLLSHESANCIAQSMKRRVAFSLAGHEPCLQLLSPADLAQAIECVLKANVAGVFNVAPDGVIPLRRALKQAGTRRIPIPHTLHGLADVLRGRSASGHRNFKRYSWTVSNEKIKAIGFKPRLTNAGALREFCLQRDVPNRLQHRAEVEQFDDFGMDPDYIAAYSRTLFRFLSDWYWRIEVVGIENIPTHGRAVLAGTHRGFMPWDGVMALNLIVKRIGRYPRFLIHPGLVKFPFLANFMTKLGGIIACQENAKRVLENDELLGVFPEGIQGAFVKYAQAYQIHDFHRDAFVKMALRHRAPIVPFVTVGSAEIFPILAKVKSRLWTKYSDWPEFPITPTFPLIPLPLPSKWHTRFLPAMHIENEHPPSAAADAAIVRAISSEVRNRMQSAIDGMLRKRRSIFFGSVFPPEAE